MSRRQSQIPKKTMAGPPRNFGETKMGGAFKTLERISDPFAVEEAETPWMFNLRCLNAPSRAF